MAYGVPEYERDAERFSEASSAAWYRFRAGLSESLDLQPIFEDFRFLFGTDLIEQLGQEPIAENRRRALVAFAVEGRIEHASLEARLELADAEMAAVAWEGETIPLRRLPARLDNLGDTLRRRRLASAARQRQEEAIPVWQRFHAPRLEAATELGWRDPAEGWASLYGLDLGRLETLAQTLLSQTEPAYRDLLAGALRLAGMEAGDATAADLGWLLRAPQFDVDLAARDLVPTVRRTMLGLGVRLEEQTALRLDLDPRPAKAPDSFVAPIHIPSEVIVAFASRGGWRDYASLLRAVGEAAQLVNVDPALPMPLRWLGDTALRAASGQVLASLLAEPAWLARHGSVADSVDFHRRVMLGWLFDLRRWAASVGYESVLLRTEPDDWEALQADYVERFGRALGAEPCAEDYLTGFDHPLGGARAFRAALFAAHLRTYLEREYDEEWFASARAGKFLVELWREGTRYTADEVLRFMGFESLEVDPLLAMLRTPHGAAS